MDRAHELMTSSTWSETDSFLSHVNFSLVECGCPHRSMDHGKSSGSLTWAGELCLLFEFFLVIIVLHFDDIDADVEMMMMMTMITTTIISPKLAIRRGVSIYR